jgi:hypothetical protein
LRICEYLDSCHTSPRRIEPDPSKNFNTSHQLHSLVATLRAAEINNLFIISMEMLWILNSRSTARIPTGIAVAGTIRVDVDCAWVKRHLTVYYMPSLMERKENHVDGSLTKPYTPGKRRNRISNFPVKLQILGLLG